MIKKKISDGVKKYHITTFGCQANLADSERIAGALENAGLKKAANREAADVLVFNTCSVRQKAEDRIFGLKKEIEKLKTVNCKLKTVLTGCMMHYDKKELARRISFVDIFLDIKETAKLPKLLGLAARASRRETEDYLKLEPKYSSGVSAGVPISYGCDNFCTYCIVPYSRNREYSRPVKDIVEEVKNLVGKGYKEIWLLGQNVNSYKSLQEICRNSPAEASAKAGTIVKFPDLLRIINSIPGDFWIRFTSPHPKDFSDDLIKAMAECEKFAHYINLPLQSGDNAVLKRMNRPYTAGHYKKLVKKIRKVIPDIAISTDIIVGFPGETKKQFENTAKAMEEIGFDMAFLSEYSTRPGTAAAKTMKDNIPHKEKECRKKILNDILTKSALANNKKLIGKTVRALNGKTEGHKTVKLSGKFPKNKFVKLKITAAGPWGLKGEVVN
ncbi:MAG: tRNA (N6-isopentenyl adenosine(37)-C2)-methylthiotransferase MiaB [bacterium]|nr:tRNA (N6-isopentenyl adenosine(37)-C2)-methylthiotransferase MiaB [bacterium]